jgi:hypothetical protein
VQSQVRKSSCFYCAMVWSSVEKVSERMIVPLTAETQRRLLRATLASAATGSAIYLIVVHVALPALQTRLTPEHIEWLRQAFVEHPVAVLSAIVALAALLALPVLGVFRWVYGPLNTVGPRRSAG